MTILRPLLPLLMLIPVIAITGTGRAAVPVPNATPPMAIRARQQPIKPAIDDRLARIFTVSAQSCVRTGNRMVC
jgi:hypothetical protein